MNPTGKPTIAFVIEELSVGGAEHMLMVMANEFVLRDWHVHMICLTKAGELATGLDSAVQLHVLNKRPGVDPGLPKRLNRCLDLVKPDVINSHLWVANFWVRLSMLLRRTPVVVTEHSRDTWKPAYYRWFDKWFARRTHRLVAVSGDTASFYQQDIGIDESIINVINNGIDTTLYSNGDGVPLRNEWHAQFNVDSDGQRTPFLIGSVGRLVSAKNHERLMDVIALLRKDKEIASHFDICLIIVGEGPGRTSLQRYANTLGIEPHIALVGTRHDIPDVMAAFDIFVLSSDREGHPLTALEAQAAGTPVVLTDAGGSGEAIARQDNEFGGVLVKPDADELSSAIRKLIVDPQLRAQCGEFARKYALENFDKRQMIDRYESIFLDAIGRS